MTESNASKLLRALRGVPSTRSEKRGFLDGLSRQEQSDKWAAWHASAPQESVHMQSIEPMPAQHFQETPTPPVQPRYRPQTHFYQDVQQKHQQISGQQAPPQRPVISTMGTPLHTLSTPEMSTRAPIPTMPTPETLTRPVTVPVVLAHNPPPDANLIPCPPLDAKAPAQAPQEES